MLCMTWDPIYSLKVPWNITTIHSQELWIFGVGSEKDYFLATTTRVFGVVDPPFWNFGVGGSLPPHLGFGNLWSLQIVVTTYDDPNLPKNDSPSFLPSIVFTIASRRCQDFNPCCFLKCLVIFQLWSRTSCFFCWFKSKTWELYVFRVSLVEA